MTIAQTAFVILLWAVLAVAVVSFVAGGLLQRRRRARLARAAHETGMLFSADDPFDMPRRYAQFSLMTGGHGARARNVTYGRLAGLAVRAFDFRCELGHGPRRLTRVYGVFVMETAADLPALSMWNQRGEEYSPLPTGQGQWRLGDWSCRGNRRVCEIAAASEVGRTAIGIETSGAVLLVCSPAGRSIAYVSSLPAAAELARALSSGATAGGQQEAAPNRQGS